MNLQEYIETLENLHKESCKYGLPEVGLCDSIPYSINYFFTYIMNPTKEDMEELARNEASVAMWGSGSSEPAYYEYTPLRETLLLLYIEWLKTDYYPFL